MPCLILFSSNKFYIGIILSKDIKLLISLFINGIYCYYQTFIIYRTFIITNVKIFREKIEQGFHKITIFKEI